MKILFRTSTSRLLALTCNGARPRVDAAFVSRWWSLPVIKQLLLLLLLPIVVALPAALPDISHGRAKFTCEIIICFCISCLYYISVKTKIPQRSMRKWRSFFLLMCVETGILYHTHSRLCNNILGAHFTTNDDDFSSFK